MTQYYVDATDGSDSNTGLSAAQAWKTLSKINGFGFVPGDIISLKKGEIWREQFAPIDSGSDENPITYNSYGAGDAPIIDGSIIPTSWSVESFNVWSTAMTTEPNAVWFNNVYGNVQTQLVDVDSQYDWWWDSNVLYVWSTQNPSTNYISPGLSAGQIDDICHIRGISASNRYQNITVDGLHFRFGNQSNIIKYTSNITIKNCDIDRMKHINFYVAVNINFKVQNCDIHHAGASHGIYLDGAETNGESYPLVESCTIHDNAHNGVQMNGNDTWQIRYPIIRYNKVYNNGWYGISSLSSLGAEIYYNLVYNCSSFSEINLDYDSVDDPDHSVPTQDAKVYNNTCFIGSSTRNDEATIRIDSWASGCEIFNNIAIGNTANQVPAIEIFPSGNATFNNNCYYDIGSDIGSTFKWMGSPCTTLALWQAAGGQDADTFASGPVFTDISTSDYSLDSATSPCINAGSLLSQLTRDIDGDGVPRGLVPDMGSYEDGYGVITVSSDTFLADAVNFIRDKIKNNVTDPIASSRPASQKFVFTSYPVRGVTYPIISIVDRGISQPQRLGMQSEGTAISLTLELRIWARNVKERDELFDSVYTFLREDQLDADGSINANLAGFQLLSAINVDEEGRAGVKSKVMEVAFLVICD